MVGKSTILAIFFVILLSVARLFVFEDKDLAPDHSIAGTLERLDGTAIFPLVFGLVGFSYWPDRSLGYAACTLLSAVLFSFIILT